MQPVPSLDTATEEDNQGVDRVEYVVDIVNLRKAFCRRRSSSYSTLKTTLLSWFSKGPEMVSGQADQTVAIQDLTMRIPKGSSIGLIGRNGSGKSTFLKLLTGIYKPTSGRVNVNGSIAALIELGAGFHPDFTGRENLFLAGAMHGLKRQEIEGKFDEIVAFAELSEVIDEPVRTYSSGMFMRLGFSIAVHTDPDILLIDEVLAVGDAGFVAKCKDRIGQLQKAGKTLIMVTHDLDSVERWCDEVIWLDKGVVKDRGHPRRVIDAYRFFIEKEEEAGRIESEKVQVAQDCPTEEKSGETLERERWGSREIEVTRVDITADEGRVARVLHPDDEVTVEMDFSVNSPEIDLDDVVFGVGLVRADGLQVFGSNTDIDRVEFGMPKDSGRVCFQLNRLGLVDGVYGVDVAVHSKTGYPFDYHKGAIQFSVRSDGKVVGVCSPERRWQIVGKGGMK